jgi:hypothetical protein
MRHRQRVVRLEEHQRKRNGRPPHLAVVQYPWDLPDGDRGR